MKTSLHNFLKVPQTRSTQSGTCLLRFCVGDTMSLHVTHGVYTGVTVSLRVNHGVYIGVTVLLHVTHGVYIGVTPLMCVISSLLCYVSCIFLFELNNKSKKKQKWIQLRISKLFTNIISIVWRICFAYITRHGVFPKNTEMSIGPFIYRIPWFINFDYIFPGLWSGIQVFSIWRDYKLV